MNEDVVSRRSVITVTATARPKRVAYLLDLDHELAGGFVDSIVRHSIQRWGGAYNPIVHTNGSTVSIDGWRVLDACDPDVVCAITGLSDSLREAIARRIGPCSIEALDDRDREHLGGALDSRAMRALETHEIPRYVAPRQIWGIPHRFLYLNDTHKADQDVRRFALHNLGTVQETISTKQSFEGLPTERLDLDQTDIPKLLDSLVGFHGRTTTIKQLCRLTTSRPYSLPHDSFALGFHLVVGDTPRDLAYAWNRALMSEEWVGQDVLWLPLSLAKNTEMVSRVSKWIGRVYHNNQDKRGSVLSHSVAIDTLKQIASVVGKDAWIYFDAKALASDEFPLPEAKEAMYGLYREPPAVRTQQIPLADQSGLLATAPPLFLTPERTHGGPWMVDLDIEYNLDAPRYSNQADLWRLPRRPSLGRAFAAGIDLARVTKSGLPTVEVSRQKTSIQLRIPSKASVLYRLFESPDAGKSKKSRFEHFQTSEQGRRVIRIIDLFGSLHYAGRTFGDQFWRTVLMGLAGVDERQNATLSERIQSVLEEVGSAGLSTIEGRTAAAQRIAGNVPYFSSPTPSVSLGDLKSRFGEMRKKDEKHEHIPQGDTFEFRRREIEGFVEAGILVQGMEVRCPYCRNAQWLATDELSSVIRCDGCQQNYPFPIDHPWRFRLNSLVRDGIVKAGVTAVLHALYETGGFARDLYLYFPCQDLHESYDSKPYTDLDIITVRDRQVIVGEVKSNPMAFLNVDFERLAIAVESARADIVILAATGDGWPKEVAEKIDEFRGKVEATGATVETLLMPW